MTVKEILVEKMRKAGYDFLTACEKSETCIREFLAEKDKSRVYFIVVSGKVVDRFKLMK